MSAAARTASCDLPAQEVRSLLEHASGWSRAQVLTRSVDDLDAAARACFERLVAARLQGEPIAYLLGAREFRSRRFVVDPRVLIPRHETEHLAEAAIDAVRRCGATHPQVLDLGTGSGILAITIALECPASRVVATDRSPDALDVARENAQRLDAAVEWRPGSWYEAIGVESFDCIVSNPPYIAVGDPHLDEGDLRFEPRQALSDGDDGLQALAEIVAHAPAHMRPDGHLTVEHGYDQGGAVRRMFRAAGLVEVVTTRDLAGRERVTSGSWIGPEPAVGPAESAAL